MNILFLGSFPEVALINRGGPESGCFNLTVECFEPSSKVFYVVFAEGGSIIKYECFMGIF